MSKLKKYRSPSKNYRNSDIEQGLDDFDVSSEDNSIGDTDFKITQEAATTLTLKLYNMSEGNTYVSAKNFIKIIETNYAILLVIINDVSKNCNRKNVQKNVEKTVPRCQRQIVELSLLLESEDLCSKCPHGMSSYLKKRL